MENIFDKVSNGQLLARLADGQLVVYPSHGVGKLEKTEHQVIDGQELQILVINFKKSRMTLRLPILKAHNAGLRALSTNGQIDSAYQVLSKKIKVTRDIWSKRAQRYEQKINSGDISLLAQVIRELYRAEGEPEQSYSERQLYQEALDRLSTEVAAVESIEEMQAAAKVESILKAA